MPLQLITPPAAEPIALALAQTHVKQDPGNDDTILSFLITAARNFAENRTQRSLVATRWKLVLDAFPGPSMTGIPFGVDYSQPANAILLPKNPVIQVVSIQYTAMDGTLQTMPTSDYALDLASEPARITPVFGKIWPITLPQIGSVQVVFDAGYVASLTADASTDQITVKGWKTLAVNDAVQLTNSGGALPAGLTASMYVQSVVSAGVYKLSATAGGAAVDITDAGSGLSFLGEVPGGILSWTLLRLGSVYAHREEVAIMSRGKIDPLPYVDGLLDPYCVWTG